MLVVSNTGPALVAGDSFKLFSKPGTGTFGMVTLPALGAGLAWTNKLAVNGSFAVVQAVNLTPTNITHASQRRQSDIELACGSHRLAVAGAD